MQFPSVLLTTLFCRDAGDHLLEVVGSLYPNRRSGPQGECRKGLGS